MAQKEVRTSLGLFKALRVISIFLRLLMIYAIIVYIAIQPQNDNDYIGARYIIFIGSLLLIGYGIWTKSILWILAFCGVAVMFYPAVLVHIKPEVWPPLALIAAVVVGLSMKFWKDRRLPDTAAKGERVKDPYRSSQKPERQRPYGDPARPSREHVLWEQQLETDVVMSVRNFLIFILEQLRPTDWEVYALKAVCQHSPAVSHLLVDGRLDVAFIKNKEIEGMRGAIKAIKEVPVTDGMTLREFFHSAFEAIYRETTYGKGDKFSWYGRDRVIATLRSYQVSTKSLEAHNPKFYDADGKELELDTTVDAATIQKVKESLDYFERSRKEQTEQKQDRAGLVRMKEKDRYHFEIKTTHPYIEFDLDAIEDAGVFKYQGSLINCLYEDLQRLLSVGSDYTYLGYYAGTDAHYDVIASSYAVGDGVLMLIKYKAAVEEVADRLYVEFQDLDQKSWVYKWAMCYKMHIEGND